MRVVQAKLFSISGVNLTFFNLKSSRQSTLCILTLNTKILQESHLLNKIENVHKVNHVLLIPRKDQLNRIMVKKVRDITAGMISLQSSYQLKNLLVQNYSLNKAINK